MTYSSGIGERQTLGRRPGLLIGLGLAIAAGGSPPVVAGSSIPNLQPYIDASGALATFSAAGGIDTTGPFFQSLGTNGRSCASCHVASQAFSVTPAGLRERFRSSNGTDPVFASNDGANCSNALPGDRVHRSLLLNKGLFRIALPVPANAQFSISVVSDPYGCALAVDPANGLLTASVYRRPLPSTNLRFLSAVMWDGRETVSALNNPSTVAANLVVDLSHQAVDATLGHAQAAASPTPDQVAGIVNFELTLSTAQIFDANAGLLRAQGAGGGPRALAGQAYYPGINDVLGQDPTGMAFNPAAFSIFGAWSGLSASDGKPAAARAAIAAGEQLFNTFPLTISNVRGLNDSAALGSPKSFTGTCTTCHDSPNVGNHSLPLPLDIGTSHSALPEMEGDPVITAALAQLDTSGLPVFLVNGCPNPFQSGQTASFYTTDPGKALNTGQCSDFNRVKGPILRGLAGRAPYFHNGAARTLLQVVRFYNARFQMGLTDVQQAQLVAFLNSL